MSRLSKYLTKVGVAPRWLAFLCDGISCELKTRLWRLSRQIDKCPLVKGKKKKMTRKKQCIMKKMKIQIFKDEWDGVDNIKGFS